MIKEMTNKKMIIDKKSIFEFCKKRMTKEEFYDKFELAPSLVASLTAETAFNIIEKTDRMLTAEEVKTLGL